MELHQNLLGQHLAPLRWDGTKNVPGERGVVVAAYVLRDTGGVGSISVALAFAAGFVEIHSLTNCAFVSAP